MEVWRKYLKAGGCTCGLILGLGLGAEIVHLSEAPCEVHRELACKPELAIQPHSTEANTLAAPVTYELHLGENLTLSDNVERVISPVSA